MPAAVAIPLITGAVGAGAELYGASKAANASKTAATQETDAAKQALGVQQQVYQQQQANLAPYQQIGASSLGNLQRLASQHVLTQNPGGWGYTPRSLGQMGTPPQSSGMVTLRAPTGETRTVPQNQAQQYIARGAQVIA